MGFINDEHEFIHTKYSQSAKPAIGFKLTDDGNYDMENKILFNVKTQNDVPDDSSYETIKKDYGSAVNKEYLNNNFLKRDKTGVYFELRGYTIQNSEVYDPNSWDDKTVTNKQYVDMKDNLKADKSDLDNKADLISQDEQSFNAPISVPDYDQNTTKSSHIVNKKYLDLTYLNKSDGDVLQNSLSFNMFLPDSKRQIYNVGNHYHCIVSPIKYMLIRFYIINRISIKPCY